MSELLLFDYWRSSAAYRVRIALNLKDVRYESRAINLLPGQDEQLSAEYLLLNPQGRVPMISTAQGEVVQSMAILEWLDETYPAPPLLPADPWTRAEVRAFAMTVACDVHPLNNLSTQRQIRAQWGDDAEALHDWGQFWVRRGCEVLEAQLADRPAHRYAFGDRPSLAALCLVPQLYNARRMELDLSGFPHLNRIDQAARAHPAFAAAAPERQPDAPKLAAKGVQ
jgi:maleylacetoacetate isomerase